MFSHSGRIPETAPNSNAKQHPQNHEWDASGFSQYGFLPEGQGNVNGTASAPIDPLFVDLAADDYRLQERSPCVDAGENKAWMAGAKDLLGLRRPRRIEGGVVDIGCYERRVFPGLLWLLK